jgi:uroporphyrinogen-III synthase
VRPDILILRPEPGASESAARADALGLRAAVAPLFTVTPVEWDPPEPADFDALLLTSANAARHGGEGLRRYLHLPCYAVGEATAAAARAAGFTEVYVGPSDGAAALADIEGSRVLHLCGRDHVALEREGLVRCVVYASEPVAELPPVDAHLALLHSPRAAAVFASLVEDKSRIRIAAISAAAADAAGEGWLSKHIAEAPRDAALLELAAKLCKRGAFERKDGRG